MGRRPGRQRGFGRKRTSKQGSPWRPESPKHLAEIWGWGGFHMGGRPWKEAKKPRTLPAASQNAPGS